ncbi:MAG: hypothetical protein IKA72_02840 [Clostridia bacterium]|nr:hypothetical protein [Clostridia bacterium]
MRFRVDVGLILRGCPRYQAQEGNGIFVSEVKWNSVVNAFTPAMIRCKGFCF